MQPHKQIIAGILVFTIIGIITIVSFCGDMVKENMETTGKSKGAIATGVSTDIEIPEFTTSESNDEADPIQHQTLIQSYDLDAHESYLLAKIAMAEAEGEDTEGKALVMLTVLNRVGSDGFPNSIEEVIYQDNPRQFTTLEPGGRFYTTEPNDDCWDALDLIMIEKWDESNGALYFERTSNGPTWHSENLTELFVHGNHTFYTRKDEDE